MDLPRTLAELTPNARNPRKVTPSKLIALKKALERFGDLGGVVFNVQSGTLVGGHQRRTALGGHCPIVRTKTYPKPTRTGTVAEGYIEVDGEAHRYREVRWDKSTEQAANIAANANAGTFDHAMLAEWFTELEADDFEVGLTMFDSAEIAALRDPGAVPAATDAAGDPGEAEILDDEGVAPPAEPVSKFGQTWALGPHTLHCGDSRNHPAAKGPYSVVFTDPPYGVSYVSRVDVKQGKGWGGIKNDELDADGLVSLLQSCVPDAPFKFICCDWNCYAAFELALGKPRSVCVWDKGHFGLGRGYRRQHEFIMFYGTLTRTDLSDMWPFKRAQNYQHPTQKPVPLVAKALADVAHAGATVYDPFGGSGSTLLAAEQLGMVATLVEFEPKYCDVIIARWEQLTGQTAELVKS